MKRIVENFVSILTDGIGIICGAVAIILAFVLGLSTLIASLMNGSFLLALGTITGVKALVAIPVAYVMSVFAGTLVISTID